MAGDERGQVATGRLGLAHRQLLDAGHVGIAGAQALSLRSSQSTGDRTRRHRKNSDIGWPGESAVRRQYLPCA